MNDKMVIQSFVFIGDKAFMVSTIERDSSARVEPPAPRFLETLVWEWDQERKERVNLVMQKDGHGAHFHICRLIMETGCIPLD